MLLLFTIYWVLWKKGSIFSLLGAGRRSTWLTELQRQFFRRTVGALQEVQEDFCHNHSLCSNSKMALDRGDDALCSGLPGCCQMYGIHEQGGEHDCTNCSGVAHLDCFVHQRPVSPSKAACHCSDRPTYYQMQSGSAFAGSHQACLAYHSLQQANSCMLKSAQETKSCFDGVSHSLHDVLDEEPVEYEYYVWDATAQEYVQTDQKTGERMLQDPNYFQYHYKLVENAQHGDAHLLPERLDGIGYAEFKETEYPSECRCADQDHLCCEPPHDECGNFHGVAPLTPNLLSTPAALTTPRRPRCTSPPAAPDLDCLLEPPLSTRRPREFYEDNDFSSDGIRYPLGDFQVSKGGSNACECRVSKNARSIQRISSGKGFALASETTGAEPSTMRSFFSCSRPWENPSLIMRDRELRVRQLKHLQRVQQLEKEELLRRQLILDKMAASLPKPSKHLPSPDVCKNWETKAPSSELQPYLKKPNRQSGVSGADRRARNDPVNRGRYFRARWKKDKFLEQQEHPAFDVKAYDAWLKSSGHLLRARALELQQEEQRLVSMLQQERNRRTKR
ncbi:hypothetical protein Efla_005054 [Eimeria flavescens]